MLMGRKRLQAVIPQFRASLRYGHKSVQSGRSPEQRYATDAAYKWWKYVQE
jgi:hypothetical protein